MSSLNNDGSPVPNYSSIDQRSALSGDALERGIAELKAREAAAGGHLYEQQTYVINDPNRGQRSSIQHHGPGEYIRSMQASGFVDNVGRLTDEGRAVGLSEQDVADAVARDGGPVGAQQQQPQQAAPVQRQQPTQAPAKSDPLHDAITKAGVDEAGSFVSRLIENPSFEVDPSNKAEMVLDAALASKGVELAREAGFDVNDERTLRVVNTLVRSDRSFGSAVGQAITTGDFGPMRSIMTRVRQHIESVQAKSAAAASQTRLGR